MNTTLNKDQRKPIGTPKLSHREQEAYYAALRGGAHIIDAHLIETKLSIKPDHAKQILHSLHVKGAVDRVLKGQYAVVSPEVLFNRQRRGVDARPLLSELMQNAGLADLYYVAYQSAAQLHNAAHQMPYVLQIASAKRRRPIHTGGMEIRFALVRPELMFGIETKQYQGTQLRVSDRERTALDLVDRPELGGGMGEVTRTLRQLLNGADPERLADYAVKLGNKSTIQRLGFLLDSINPNRDSRSFELLQKHRGRLVVPLEPGGSPNGEVNRVWRIRVNVELEDTEW